MPAGRRRSILKSADLHRSVALKARARATSSQGDRGGTPIGSLFKGLHEFRFFQDRSHDLPLCADPFSMNNAHKAKTFLRTLIQILFHHDLHIARSKRMEVERIRDGNFFHYSAQIAV